MTKPIRDEGAEPEEPTAQVSPPLGSARVALWGIFLILLGFALHFARSVALPLAIAALASLALRPIVRTMGRALVPAPLAAAVVLIGMLGALGYGLVALSGPAADWASRAPEAAREAERKLRFLSEPVANVNESTEKIQQAAGKAAGIPGADEFPTVVVRSRSVSEILFAHTQGFVIGLLITSVLLYYFLAAPDDFLERLLGLAPRLDDKKRLVAAMREIQTEVSRYLLTISMINLALGAVVAAALVALGVPNAALWGVLAAVANFVPYVGAIVFGLVLAGVGILSFDGPLHMLLPAGVFSVLHLLESYVVTPFVLGRRLTLSPVAVFVWVLFWSWLWGIPGGLIAVPLLAALKISLQHVPPLVPYARLIG